MDIAELASHIDHTVLRPDARRADVEQACQVARELGCAAVCVNSIHVALASRLLAGSSVLVVGVVGFPFGATYTAVKVLETELAIQDGADEIDMVIAIGQLKDDELELVESDIASVVRAAAGRPVKVILECGLLTDAQKKLGAEIVAKAGAAFVKTSTGFLGSGATVHDVTLLHEAVGTRLSVKATGGIRFFEDAVALLEAGASRLGASRTEAVLASQVDRSKAVPLAQSLIATNLDPRPAQPLSIGSSRDVHIHSGGRSDSLTRVRDGIYHGHEKEPSLMRLTYLGVLVAALLAISACGGATTPTATPAALPSSSQEPTASAPTSGEPSGETVEITVGTDTGAELRFDPAELTVRAGADTRVTFENRASVPHNLTFQAPINVATSTVVAPGTSETVQFKALAAGEYPFVCTLHPGMGGKLTVKAG